MIDAIARILNRRSAYRRVFPIERGVFVGDARTVMADLAAFCRPNEVPLVRDETGATDAYQTGVRAGRLEVFNRIRAMIHIEDHHLFNLKETAE